MSARSAEKWQEAVIVTADQEQWRRIFAELASWSTVHCGAVPTSEAKRLGAPDAALSECLYANPGDERGWVRVLETQSSHSAPRVTAMPWDSGGFFSLMFYSTDVASTYSAAESFGFGALAPPVRLRAGASRLSNVVIRGPDGVNLAAYQRHSPPLTQFPNMRRMSTAFNVMMMVQDLKSSARFLEDVLGFDQVAAGDFLDSQPGVNNFGLPHNWADNLVRRFAVFGESADLDGRVEILKFVGLTGRAIDPGDQFHRGLLALRFPVDNLDAALADIEAKPMADPLETNVLPYGRIRSVTFLGPEGGRFELFEVL